MVTCPTQQSQSPRLAFQPNGYVSSETYPEEVNLVDRNSPLFNYTLGTSSFDREYDENIDSGYIYVPTTAYWDYTGDYPVLKMLEYYVLTDNLSACNSLGNVYAFSYTFDSATYFTFREFNSAPVYKTGIGSVISSYQSVDVIDLHFYDNGCASHIFDCDAVNAVTSPTLDLSNFLDILSPYCWWLTILSKDGYASGQRVGYENGYSDGKTDGYNWGYTIGYNTAIDTTGEEGIMTTIFDSVLGIPISIINGLTPFVIWDVPIVYIIFTFLFFATLIYIVKRFIS